MRCKVCPLHSQPPSATSRSLLIRLNVLLALLLLPLSHVAGHGIRVKRMYVFGDSYLDTGER